MQSPRLPRLRRRGTGTTARVGVATIQKFEPARSPGSRSLRGPNSSAAPGFVPAIGVRCEPPAVDASLSRFGAPRLGAPGGSLPTSRVSARLRRSTRPVGSAAAERGWRRGRDSNPRGACAPSGFQDRRLRPLGHLSAHGQACNLADPSLPVGAVSSRRVPRGHRAPPRRPARPERTHRASARPREPGSA